MSEHRLTISATNGDGPDGRPCPIRIPTLHLAGAWLEDAGFPIGVEVQVEVVEPGCLLVTRVEDEAEEGELLLPLVWIPAEQLGRLEQARREAVADA